MGNYFQHLGEKNTRKKKLEAKGIKNKINNFSPINQYGNYPFTLITVAKFSLENDFLLQPRF